MDRRLKSFEVQARKVYLAMNLEQTGKGDSGKSSERKKVSCREYSVFSEITVTK